MKFDKAVKKGISLKASQIDQIGRVIDTTKHGQFSQFIQDAVDEKLARIEKPTKRVLKAS